MKDAVADPDDNGLAQSADTPKPDEGATPDAEATFDSGEQGSALFGTRKSHVHLVPGTVMNGRYRIESVLGEGGMGVVYQVHDRARPDRPVALKTIRSNDIRPAQLDQLKAEFRSMASLRHPNIAAVYDFEAFDSMWLSLLCGVGEPSPAISHPGKGWPANCLHVK